MDLTTVLGFVAALAMVLVGGVLEGLHLSSLIGPTAFIIVVGGTVGATIMSHTRDDLKHLAVAAKQTVFAPKFDFKGTITYLVEMAEKARRTGLLSLQPDIPNAPHPILVSGLTMAVDGGDPAEIREVLESVSKLKAEEMHHAAAVCDTAGGYCPTLGVMGTVMGLIHVMGSLDKPETLGPAIAVAFLATLYGVGFANMIFIPMATKIKLNAHKQAQFETMMIEGVVGLQTGQNPRFLREKLEIYDRSHAAAPKASAEGAKK